jgi:polar amino acid transport system substrate-binding protein
LSKKHGIQRQSIQRQNQKISALMSNFRFWNLDFTGNFPAPIANFLKSKITQFFGLGLCLSLVGSQILIGSIGFPLPGDAAQWPEILERGTLIVAVKDNLRPLGFRTPDGTLQGLEIDLAHRLAADLLGDANAVKLQPVSNVNRLPMVFNHQVDVAIASVTANRVRSRLVDFSLPYYLDGTALVTKTGVPDLLHGVATGAGQKIAVLNGSSTIAIVRYHLPAAQLVGVDSYQEAYSRLEAGEASAFAGDASTLAGWVQEYPAYSLRTVQLGTQPLAVVMPKGQQYAELRAKVNQAIAALQADGWLRERTKYWGLPLPPAPE